MRAGPTAGISSCLIPWGSVPLAGHREPVLHSPSSCREGILQPHSSPGATSVWYKCMAVWVAAGQAGHLLAAPREQLPCCCPQPGAELGGWRPSLSHGAVQGGCSARQGSLGVVAPGAQGPSGWLSCAVLCRERAESGAAGLGLRWPWCSGPRAVERGEA